MFTNLTVLIGQLKKMYPGESWDFQYQHLHPGARKMSNIVRIAIQSTRERKQQPTGTQNLPCQIRPTTQVNISLPAEAFNHCLQFKDNNPIMHLANYEMLRMDRGKSFLIPTETSQCPEIWDLIKPVLLLQMLQLLITFSRPFSIQHGIHIYNLPWHRSPLAQPQAVRHLPQLNEIYRPFCLIFFIQGRTSQKCVFFLMMSHTLDTQLQVYMAVGLMIEWDGTLAQIQVDTKTNDMNFCLGTIISPTYIFLILSSVNKAYNEVFLKEKWCCGPNLWLHCTVIVARVSQYINNQCQKKCNEISAK